MSSTLNKLGVSEPILQGSSCGSPTSATPSLSKQVNRSANAGSSARVLEKAYGSEWSSGEKGNLRKKLSKTLTKQSLEGAEGSPVPFEGHTKMPWMTIDGVELNWSPRRKAVARIITSHAFDGVISAFILLNFILIIYEADRDAMCFPKYDQNPDQCPFSTNKMLPIKILDITFLVIYSVEALLHIYVSRLEYLKSRWHQLDAVVLVAGWTGELATSMINLNFLRIIRVMRLTKAIRIVVGIRELYLLLNGFMSSMRAIFFGTLLLMMVLLGLAIIMVEMVHPINSKIVYYGCTECTIGYHTVLYAVMTLFKQLIAGDSWIISFPVLDEAPFTGVIMVSIVVIVMLGVTNLILTVIVERAAEARDKDKEDQAKQKVREQAKTKKQLMKMCERMDADGSGRLTQNELLNAFRVSEDFRNIMMLLDVQECDLEAIFKLLDQDESGDLDYEEFCEELIQLETQDQRLTLAMTRLGVVEIRQIQNVIDAKIGTVIQTLGSHSSGLLRLDSKLDRLLARSDGLNASETCEKPKPLAPEPVTLQQAKLVSTSEGLDIADDLLRIAQDMQHVSLLESDMVQNLEQQIAALNSHAEIVTSVSDYLRLDDSSHQEGQHTPASAASEKIGSFASKLRDNLQGMNDAVTESVQHFGQIAGSLDANQLLLHGVKHEVLLLADTKPDTATPVLLRPSWPRLVV